MTKPKPAAALGVLLAGLCAAAPASAAGGHHAVDDAVLLEPGQCQFEAWYDRASGGGQTLVHAGPACRLGAVEVGLNLDRSRAAGSAAARVGSVQLKWAHSLGGGWSSGLVLGLAARDRAPHEAAATVIVPLSWQAAEGLLAHVNVGRDFRRGQRDSRRAGLALEWTPSLAHSLIAERFDEGPARFRRFGVRWAWSPAANVDLSRSRGIDGGTSAWTLGFGWVFER